MRKSKYKSYSVPSKAGFRVAFSFYILHGVVPFALVSLVISCLGMIQSIKTFLLNNIKICKDVAKNGLLYGDDYDEDLDEEEGQGWGQSM